MSSVARVLPYGLLGSVIFPGWMIMEQCGLGMTNDPANFCHSPDPTPLAWQGPALTVQECSAGKTFTIRRGETIFLDLTSQHGVDTGFGWGQVGVSDSSVLGTVAAPAVRDDRNAPGVCCFADVIAVFRGLRLGAASINAVRQYCNHDRCTSGDWWSVDVRVT